jgi:hypothetical protein
VDRSIVVVAVTVIKVDLDIDEPVGILIGAGVTLVGMDNEEVLVSDEVKVIKLDRIWLRL